jgi:hypothetical protein
VVGLATATDVSNASSQGEAAAAVVGLALQTSLEALIATVGVAGAGLTALPPMADVYLAATQPHYAPAKAGDKMDLKDSPNVVAIDKFVIAQWSKLAETLTVESSIGKNLATLTITGRLSKT